MLENYKNELFDVVIQGGQSNAEGCGMGPLKNFYTPTENILYLNSDLTISVAEERVWDDKKVNEFALSFAGEYIKKGRLDEGRKILIVRAAVGGTGWSDKRWGMSDDLYLKMMEMIKAALDLNPENRLVAFLWHQGETDCGSAYEVHYKHLRELVESVRGTYNCPELPFVAGDFVSEWKTANLAICEPVAAAIKDVCRDIGRAGFADTADLTSNSQATGSTDIIHFSREALYLLGVRYFEIFVNL